MEDDSKEIIQKEPDAKEIAKQTASSPLGPLMVPARSEVVKLPTRSRQPVGPVAEPNAEETAILQAKVFEAVKGVLPKDWEFQCCILGPNGEKEMVGSLKGNNQNLKFLRALESAVKTYVWRQ